MACRATRTSISTLSAGLCNPLSFSSGYNGFSPFLTSSSGKNSVSGAWPINAQSPPFLERNVVVGDFHRLRRSRSRALRIARHRHRSGTSAACIVHPLATAAAQQDHILGYDLGHILLLAVFV